MDQLSRAPSGSPAVSASPVIRRTIGATNPLGQSLDIVGETEVANPTLDLDELVDKVIDRIEQRVIDELERRGRRQYPGVF